MPHERLSHRKHVPNKALCVLIETLDDFTLLTSVWHEVFKDDTTFNQGLHIEFLFENSLHEVILFCRSESLIVNFACISEWQCLILVLELNFKLFIFCFFIKNVIIEENENYDFLLRIQAVLVYNMLNHLLFLGIGGPYSLMVCAVFWVFVKTLKLVKQDINTTCRCHE